MNISFTLELSSSKDSRQQASILIRMTQNRKLKRLATGLKVSVAQWDPVRKKIRKLHPQHQVLNKVLDAKLSDLIGRYGRLYQADPSVTMEELVRDSTGTVTSNFFDFAYTTKLAEIKSRNQMGTYRRYEAVLSKLKIYAGQSLTLKSITYGFLQEYSLYLKTTLKNTDDTVSANMSVIRAILNEAIRHDLYPDKNPFNQIQLKYTDNTKEKLTAAEMNQLFSVQLPAIHSLQVARDFFLACFLAEGTRAGDMMTIQKSNLVNGCLDFRQQKTGKRMIIPIMPDLQLIFRKYETKDSAYLFPFFTDPKTVNERSINTHITVVNKYLKEVCKYAGIFKKVSTHCARHTFVDLALAATGENIYLVQQSVGHSTVKTTEMYARNRVSYNKESLAAKVLHEVKTEKQVTGIGKSVTGSKAAAF